MTMVAERPASESENVGFIVYEATKQAPAFVAFRPKGDSVGLDWDSISSIQVVKHLEGATMHWREMLTCPPGSVVGIWLTGKKYSDGINILALICAGYVPELFSVAFANHDVVWDLMVKSGAAAIVFDQTFAEVVDKWHGLQARHALSLDTLEALPRTEMLAAPVVYQDSAMIVHSSGTTSGMPKLIPCTHGWVTSYVTVKFAHMMGSSRAGDTRPDVMNTLGSLAHVGSFVTFAAALYNRICTVQTPSSDMPTEELVAMIKTCGLNRIVLYATYLATYIRDAKDNSELLEMLRNCKQIIHTGVTLNLDEEEWAYQNDLPIVSSYGASETAPVMITRCGNAQSDRYLRLIPGLSAELIPSEDMTDADNPNRQFFEIVVRTGNVDSPHSSLISSDGLHHTGDLFEEVEPGLYRFRGRSGDWIKTLGGFCDAKSIEDNVRNCCADIVHEVVLVGSNRPGPCLLLEIKEGVLFATPETKDNISQIIIERTACFNERLFMYERVDKGARIHLMPINSLPRTKEKGNVRRSAAEELYASVLDDIFQASTTS